jgi:single-strand DNA-binding protein
MSINRATIEGHLGSDPQLGSFPNGGRSLSFSIATTETWKDKATGDKKERTQWHRVVCFMDWMIDAVSPNLAKGTRCLVEGQIETREYEKDGIKRTITEIVVRAGGSILPINWPRSDRAPPPQDSRSSYGAAKAGAAPAGQTPRATSLDDDIPF